MKKLSVVVAVAIASLSSVSFAVPPECKEPNAPRGCFEKLKFKLAPIEECDMAPVFDPENNRITYPCGLKVVPSKPKFEAQNVKSGSALRTKKLNIPLAQVRYMGGSTIHDNGDGTSTIDHGGSANETINTKDAGQTVKDYGDKGIKITPK